MLDIATLNEICAQINNYFVVCPAISGDFKIIGGKIETPLADIHEGDYIKICGSRHNDGAHRYNSGDLEDEEFNGRIYLMAMPKDFKNLIAEIAEWKEKNKKQLLGVFQSESFGGYSYTLDTADGRTTLQGAFGNRLNRYRKI